MPLASRIVSSTGSGGGVLEMVVMFSELTEATCELGVEDHGAAVAIGQIAGMMPG